MTSADHWERMYEMPLGQVPWEIDEPPAELVSLVENNQIEAGDALDIACGTGNYSFYLASVGFNVTGVDFSENAITIARGRNERLGLPVEFLIGDVTRLNEIIDRKKFHFVLDYSLIHHLADDDLARHALQFADRLNTGGKLLVVCYSDLDERAGEGISPGDYGNLMYFRKRSEIESLYKGLDLVSYSTGHLGKKRQHPAHSFLFEK